MISDNESENFRGLQTRVGEVSDLLSESFFH